MELTDLLCGTGDEPKGASEPVLTDVSSSLRIALIDILPRIPLVVDNADTCCWMKKSLGRSSEYIYLCTCVDFSFFTDDVGGCEVNARSSIGDAGSRDHMQT